MVNTPTRPTLISQGVDVSLTLTQRANVTDSPTCLRQDGNTPPVTARSEATWQSKNIRNVTSRNLGADNHLPTSKQTKQKAPKSNAQT